MSTSRQGGEPINRPSRSAQFLAEATNQPQLIAASLGTIAVGVLAKRGDLVRGGSRMLAAHLVASAATSAIRQRLNQPRAGPAMADDRHLTDLVATAAIGWLSEALVSAVFDRIEARAGRIPASHGA